MQGARAPQPSGTNRPSSFSPHLPPGPRGLAARRVPTDALSPSNRCAAPRALRSRPGQPGGRRPPVGGHSMRGTPGPVPNPEAKPHRAESTAGSARGRPGRRRPVDGTGPFGPEGAAGVSPAAPFFVPGSRAPAPARGAAPPAAQPRRPSGRRPLFHLTRVAFILYRFPITYK